LRRAAYLQITQKTEEQHMQKDAAEKAIAIGQDPVLASQAVADNSGKYFDFFLDFFRTFPLYMPTTSLAVIYSVTGSKSFDLSSFDSFHRSNCKSNGITLLSEKIELIFGINFWGKKFDIQMITHSKRLVELSRITPKSA